jgi:hypothetical protein
MSWLKRILDRAFPPKSADAALWSLPMCQTCRVRPVHPPEPGYVYCSMCRAEMRAKALRDAARGGI